MANQEFSREEPVAVVIGTGAGGGNVARELCLNGVNVVALEAGPRYDPESDFEADEWTMFNKLAWLDPVIAAGDDTPSLPAWLCKTVGGTTVHWAGASLRFQPHEFKARTTYGGVDGTSLVDWPISLEDLLPFYEQAERYMGVTGRVQPLPPPNTNLLVMQKGADALGLHARPGHMAVNATGEYDGRPQCDQRGYCFQGCSNRAMWSTLTEAIPKAEATGRLEVRPNSQAVYINTANGKVKSVTYAHPDGTFEEQAARLVVVSANSIQTPRLLLHSTSSRFPDGLANGSGQVGRNYMRHLTASSYAIFPNPVHAYKGITMMGIVDDFASNRPDDRGFTGGFYLETIMLGPAFAAVFIGPSPATSRRDARALWGEALADLMENYTHLAGNWIVGEDMPQESNSVTLHATQKDQFGVPVPVVTFNDHSNDRAMRAFAWTQSRQVWEAAGAAKVFDTPPYPSTHNLGTCRMGSDPGNSVVNQWGQAHEVKNLFVADGSVFATGAAENPTLTISALAIRTAHYIIEQMKAAEI
jgi:choline dehydrogenase-like flavoprotein